MISKSCMLFDGSKWKGMWLSMGTPRMHRMFGHSQVEHVHALEGHVHCMNCFGNVLSWGRLCHLLMFTMV